ncbi:hypothetical protein GLW00_13260 [Halobacillus litoralis]|uniref:Uncharacterized protein n=1 Tax=Halobacillus litoralis TaxID=45668 RepID=A0A845FDB3_9BACI|nr:hypothetical protein [Halobacillus litoralis]MYL71829.1 hypothetical protein [Halobacillus litoralis]
MYTARPPRWVLPAFAPIYITDLREQDLTILTLVSFAVVLLIFGGSYQLKVDQTIQYHVCFFHLRVLGSKLHPEDIHKIVFKDAGWGKPAGTIKRKRGLPIRVMNFNSVEVLAELKCFAERHQIRVEERKYYRTVYDQKMNKEKQRA